ncbi:hypothetical protein H696_03637 [Fonticula alba]|uniref:Beta-Casp domain-containing protein n=1 Tax=Fonticula alba TaxID=691883 RepID=A0A058Z8C7_FONAL|nr:hypothetical protein H696_03637 [Fonticula alba]KCV70178.1 hypothetical protein H696_03637 [Fonticula alba]|eukprot:XP_009495784.1 hypothetical protein H696_03637 [Fonticula alba]
MPDSVDVTCLDDGPHGATFLVRCKEARILIGCPLDTTSLLRFMPRSGRSDTLVPHGGAVCFRSPVTGAAFIDTTPGSPLLPVPRVPGGAVGVDVVLVPHALALLGVAYLFEAEPGSGASEAPGAGFTGAVYTTEPALELARLLMEEMSAGMAGAPHGGDDGGAGLSISVDRLIELLPEGASREYFHNARRDGLSAWRPVFSPDAVRRCLDSVVTVTYLQELDLSGGLTAIPTPSGLAIGACNWLVRLPSLRTLGVVCSAADGASHPTPLDLNSLAAADALVVSGCQNPGVLERGPFADRVGPSDWALREICRLTTETVSRRGSVIIPMLPSGLQLDLLGQLAQHLTNTVAGPAVPIYVVSPVAGRALAQADVASEWLRPELQERARLPAPPFDHADLAEKGRLIQVSRLSDLAPNSLDALARGEPAVVVLGHPALRFGDAVHLVRALLGGHGALGAAPGPGAGLGVGESRLLLVDPLFVAEAPLLLEPFFMLDPHGPPALSAGFALPSGEAGSSDRPSGLHLRRPGTRVEVAAADDRLTFPLLVERLLASRQSGAFRSADAVRTFLSALPDLPPARRGYLVPEAPQLFVTPSSMDSTTTMGSAPASRAPVGSLGRGQTLTIDLAQGSRFPQGDDLGVISVSLLNDSPGGPVASGPGGPVSAGYFRLPVSDASILGRQSFALEGRAAAGGDFPDSPAEVVVLPLSARLLATDSRLEIKPVLAAAPAGAAAPELMRRRPNQRQPRHASRLPPPLLPSHPSAGLPAAESIRKRFMFGAGCARSVEQHASEAGLSVSITRRPADDATDASGISLAIHRPASPPATVATDAEAHVSAAEAGGEVPHFVDGAGGSGDPSPAVDATDAEGTDVAAVDATGADGTPVPEEDPVATTTTTTTTGDDASMAVETPAVATPSRKRLREVASPTAEAPGRLLAEVTVSKGRTHVDLGTMDLSDFHRVSSAGIGSPAAGALPPRGQDLAALRMAVLSYLEHRQM